MHELQGKLCRPLQRESKGGTHTVPPENGVGGSAKKREMGDGQKIFKERCRVF